MRPMTALKVKQLQEELGARGATMAPSRGASERSSCGCDLRALIIAAVAENKGTDTEPGAGGRRVSLC
jgi:hypothetical protein